MNSEKVVVTGMGVIAPNGICLQDFCRTISQTQTKDYTDIYSGALEKLEIEKLCSKNTRRTDRFTNMALAAFEQAFRDTGFSDNTYDSKRTGLIIGTTFGPTETISTYLKKIIDGGMENASPMLFPNTVINAAAGKISMDYKLKGANSVICGASVVNYSSYLIKTGKADVVFAGGVDTLNPLLRQAFQEKNKCVVLSEGSAFLVLEGYSHAIKRNAPIYGEIAGIGLFVDEGLCDSLTTISKDSIAFTMKKALENANVAEAEIKAVAPLACSLSSLQVEKDSIKEVFSHADNIHLLSSKKIYGEAFGASELFGAIEALTTSTCVDGCVLANSMNIGGNVTSIVIKKFVRQMR